jgi:hypothetical protein
MLDYLFLLIEILERVEGSEVPQRMENLCFFFDGFCGAVDGFTQERFI